MTILDVDVLQLNMKLVLLTLVLALSAVHASLLEDLDTVMGALDHPENLEAEMYGQRRRRELSPANQELLDKIVTKLHEVEQFGTEKAKAAKAKLMELLKQVKDFRLLDWLKNKTPFGKRESN